MFEILVTIFSCVALYTICFVILEVERLKDERKQRARLKRAVRDKK